MPKQNGLGWTTLSVDNASAAAKDIRNDVHELREQLRRGA
jgi:hypothetical protein